LLQFHATRSTLYGLEMHLAMFHKMIREFEPQVVVIDPIGNLVHAGNRKDTTAMLTRLIDYLKVEGVTAFLTSLTTAGLPTLETTDVDMSSLVDTWLLLRDIESSGERNRAMYVLKSRGMAHSNQLREFLLTDHGIELQDVYQGPEGVLTGSARQSQEARERAEALLHRQEVEREQRNRARKREALEARITAMRKEFEAEDEEASRRAAEATTRETVVEQNREAMGRSRRADNGPKVTAAPNRLKNVGGNR
jgi:circadian clock protein KaiC